MKEYLSITIHDNDFSRSLKIVCDLLYRLFEEEGEYPTEGNLPVLKKYIRSMWYGVHNTLREVECSQYYQIRETDISIFEPDLKFVNCEKIPEWDNGETAYIPMFDDGRIIIR